MMTFFMKLTVKTSFFVAKMWKNLKFICVENLKMLSMILYAKEFEHLLIFYDF